MSDFTDLTTTRGPARRLLTLALAACLALAGGCRQGSMDPRYPDVPIKRFAQVDTGLFRGAQPDADGFSALKGLGVKTVLNFRLENPDQELAPSGIDVVQLPAHINKPNDEEIKAFFAIALDPARRPVFMHCAEGRERTGFYTALYRIEIEGWTPEHALQEMRAFGFRDADRPEVVAYISAYKPRGYGAGVAQR